MSSFEAGLRAARRRQHLIYGLIVVGFAAVALMVGGFLMSSRGIAVKVLPSEASDTATIQVSDGWATVISRSVYSISPAPTVEVSAKGFRPSMRTLEPSEYGTTIVVTMVPLPGLLTMNTHPPDEKTRWWIAGSIVSTGAELRQELEASKYDVVVDHPYFEIESVVAEVLRGETTPLEVELRAVQGSIAIASRPSGATVHLDDAELGTTPLERQLPGGTYSLRISHAGFDQASEEIQVTNTERNLTRNYRLRRLQAYLTVALTPADGSLLLDGKLVDPGVRHPVTANAKHALSYELEGYQPFSDSFTLKPREVRQIDIVLNPDIGVVEVRSSPVATAYVNGASVGEAPVTLQLPAKKAVIELRRSGYRTVRETIVPTSRHKTTINAKLTTELASRLAESPKQFTNSAGIEMTLFQPGELVMGAPRDEKGQRANEFLRKVRLKKPFYAARREVSNEAYKRFNPNNGGHGEPKHPVTSISWIDAAKFCNWLSKNEKLEPFYNFSGDNYIEANSAADGYRMLTEAEWEWLARRAGRSKQSVFSWGNATKIPKGAGNIADESARGLARFFVPNYIDSFAKTAPVGSFPPESSGLHDLTGNVSEWVHDFYSLRAPDPDQTHVDPLGANSGDVHIVKGSSWRSGTRTTLRAAYREGLVGSRDDVGFRIGRYLYGGDDVASKQ